MPKHVKVSPPQGWADVVEQTGRASSNWALQKPIATSPRLQGKQGRSFLSLFPSISASLHHETPVLDPKQPHLTSPSPGRQASRQSWQTSPNPAGDEVWKDVTCILKPSRSPAPPVWAGTQAPCSTQKKPGKSWQTSKLSPPWKNTWCGSSAEPGNADMAGEHLGTPVRSGTRGAKTPAYYDMKRQVTQPRRNPVSQTNQGCNPQVPHVLCLVLPQPLLENQSWDLPTTADSSKNHLL